MVIWLRNIKYKKNDLLYFIQMLSIEAMPKMIRSNVLRNLDKFPNLRKLGEWFPNLKKLGEFRVSNLQEIRASLRFPNLRKLGKSKISKPQATRRV
jgi:hypothetical protein